MNNKLSHNSNQNYTFLMKFVFIFLAKCILGLPIWCIKGNNYREKLKINVKCCLPYIVDIQTLTTPYIIKLLQTKR